MSSNLFNQGVIPSWLGKTSDGRLVEFISDPWPAGREIFVLVQEVGKPETAECIDLRQITPMRISGKKAA